MESNPLMRGVISSRNTLTLLYYCYTKGLTEFVALYLQGVVLRQISQLFTAFYIK